MSSYVSNTISGGVSFNGVGSGTDFDAMIAALKQVEQIPSQRMSLWKGEWEYRIAAMEEVLLVMGEAKGVLSDYNSLSKMMDIKVESSEKEVASATIKAGSNIAEGNYSINVKQVAKSHIFSTKDMFPEKNSIINDTDPPVDQEFSYTYQGVTRDIKVQPGTTLEQLLMRVNNDAQNPGVRASLIKNGDQYMFQIQGNDTGLDSELSISSTVTGFDNDMLFTAENAPINNTGADQTFSMFYGSKSLEGMPIPKDMTAGGFVEAFNSNPDNPGVTAALVRQGSDYIIEYRNKTTNSKINPPTSSSIPELGGTTGFTLGSDSINDTNELKNYTYSFGGKDYTVPVAQGLTLDQLVTTINEDSNNPGVTAFLETDATTGKLFLKMEVEDAPLVTPAGIAESIEITYIDEFNVGHLFTVGADITMKEYVVQFNAFAKANGLDAKVAVVPSSSVAGGSKLEYKTSRDVVIPAPNIRTSVDGADPEGADNIFTKMFNGELSYTLATMDHDGGSASTIPGLGDRTAISGKDTVVNDTGVDKPYTFTHGGKTHTVQIPSGTTFADFPKVLNDQLPADAGIKAKMIESPSGYSLAFEDAAGVEITPTNIITDMEFLKSGGDNWHEQEPQDAIFSLNGWDLEMTSSSNTLDEAIGGMTITIKSEGETQLNIVSDTSILEENIVQIVDALNLVKATILKLSEVDTDKQVASPDDETDEDGNPKMSSQFTWQSGSALTGNYGVQMLLSQFSGITSSSAYGFIGMSNENDASNDPFTALSHLGITTVTNPSEDNFGLLEIDHDKLNEAIEKDATAVAELFSSQLSGSTTSEHFTVASVGTAAKAGTYDVEYDVDANGSVMNVFINGAEALNDPAYPGRFTVADSTNDALGIALQFNPSGMQEGKKYTGDIRIKQGKVNEMISFLNDELKRTSLKDEPQGTLPTIISNYSDIAKNLQTKIDSEAKRISSWEQRKKLEFARLDALLGEYDSKMQQVANMMPTGNK